MTDFYDGVCVNTARRLVDLARIIYEHGVSVSNHIKAAALSICLLGVNTTAAQAREQARDLTPQERSVCASLKTCLDIVERHDASEFDYEVLQAEFRRFGPRGKSALFEMLGTDDGQADIAEMISNLGPLTAQDRQRIQAKWTADKADVYLPLLLDGHPMSRDLLLRSVGHPNANVREQVSIALGRLPQDSARAPLPKTLQAPLLSALLVDPIAETAPYIARLDAAGQEKHFAALLRSADRDIVTAAYSALYRNNQAQAFNALLAEMEKFETPAQARAVGQMLATRHKSRQDGFYLKFAQDMSGDPKLSASSRASGLHALIEIAGGPFPKLTPARAEALSFLVKGQPRITQEQYFPYLTAAGADTALEFIWDVAQFEKWENRDRIARFYARRKSYDKVITDLIKSDDIRTFLAGLNRAEPSHEPLIKTKINHPVKAIASVARQKLKLPPGRTSHQKCPIRAFDLEDMRAQMPFFEGGWMIADDQARVSVSRSHLTTAHPSSSGPSSSGWLAGYDLRKSAAKSNQSGGSILHYDNKSGAFKTVGSFAGPRAILPGRPLKLGQSTAQFWVIDGGGEPAAGVSAYTLDLTGRTPRMTHVGILPKTAKDFSVIPNGDLLVVFDGADQPPVRLSKGGQISLACAPVQSSSAPRAPR